MKIRGNNVDVYITGSNSKFLSIAQEYGGPHKMSDYENKVIRKYLKIRGFVQGVGFRYRAVHAADKVGATGWVCNDPDGAVSMEIQGTEEQIDKVLEMINRGRYVDIESMDVKTLPVKEAEYSFRVRGY